MVMMKKVKAIEIISPMSSPRTIAAKNVTIQIILREEGKKEDHIASRDEKIASPVSQLTLSLLTPGI